MAIAWSDLRRESSARELQYSNHLIRPRADPLSHPCRRESSTESARPHKLFARGQKFDPHVHHAVEMVETEEHEDHSILDEYQRGYNFRGRLLRPAMVKVAVKKS